MAEKRSSSRTQRHWRLQLAQRIATQDPESSQPSKKPCVCSGTPGPDSGSVDPVDGPSPPESLRPDYDSAAMDDRSPSPDSSQHDYDSAAMDDTSSSPDLEFDASSDEDGSAAESARTSVDGGRSVLGDWEERGFEEGSDHEMSDDMRSNVDSEDSLDITCSDESSLDSVVPQCTSSPLFSGSQVCSEDFKTSIMAFIQRHNLTYACQSDLLKLLSIVFPAPNQVPSSAYSLNSSFMDYKKETVTTRYCGNCLEELGEGLSCLKASCLRTKERPSAFVRVPLSLQLRERFKGMHYILWVHAIIAGHRCIAWAQL